MTSSFYDTYSNLITCFSWALYADEVPESKIDFYFVSSSCIWHLVI